MITVFTPTYNRINDLKKLYISLIDQTEYSFIWMIVDDGSTDETRSFVKSIEKEAKFEIIYHYQENSGKHIAINWALDNCVTKFLLCVDSDDQLSNDAIEKLSRTCSENDVKYCWAIVGPRFSDNGELPKWSNKIPKVTLFSWIYTKYGYTGETFMLWNLEWFGGVRFPQYSEERFMPESAIYESLDQKTNVKTLFEKIYISEYHNDGLTVNSRTSFSNNRSGYAYANYECSLNKNRSIIQRSIYYGRCRAIQKCGKMKVKEIEPQKENIAVRFFSNFSAFAFYCVYTLRK